MRGGGGARRAGFNGKGDRRVSSGQIQRAPRVRRRQFSARAGESPSRYGRVFRQVNSGLKSTTLRESKSASVSASTASGSQFGQ